MARSGNRVVVEPVCPIVHDNGTSKAELLRLREEAYAAISDTVEKLRQMAPNGRDYYPEPGRMEQAEEQHKRRCRALTDMLTELEAECLAINGL